MKRIRLNLDLTVVMVLLAVGVLVPVMLATATGIVALATARDAGGIVTGVLIVCFAVTAAGCALVTVVLAGRKARLARLQADFMAQVSHELKTPLSAIRLYAQTLQSGRLAGDPAQTERCLATIVREAAWLDALIDRMLMWRAAAREALPLTETVQPVGSAVVEAVERFKAMTHPADMALSCAMDSRLPVRHDPRAIQAILLNLLTNAYKYTGPAKRIGVRVWDEAGHVQIEVCDNGIGLSPAEARRVFQPFYRAVNPRTGGTGGVGLGLAIVRHLVILQGGTIEVESRTAQGSAFRIRLPAVEAEA